jgi:PAS domain S-box-containing protein
MNEQLVFSSDQFARRVRQLLSWPTPKWLSELIGQSFRVLLVSVSYYLAVLASLKVRIGPTPLAVFWPSNAILLAALVLTPKRRWWLYLLAVVPAHLLAFGVRVADPGWIAVQVIHNTVLATLAAALWQKYGRAPLRFERFREALVFVLVSIVASGVSTLLIVAFVLHFAPANVLARHGWTQRLWFIWGRSWLTDFVSIFVFVPVFVTWIAHGVGWFRGIRARRFAEAGILAALLVVVSFIAFGGTTRDEYLAPALFVAPLPLLLWASARFGPTGACTAVATIVCISGWCTHRGEELFLHVAPIDRAIALQLFWILLSVPFFLLMADIEDRKLSLLGLRESENRFRQLVEEAPIGVVLESVGGQFSLVNPAFCSILGYSELEMLAMNCAQLSHPEDLERESPLFQELQNGRRSSYQIEKRFFHKNGAEVWGHVSVSLLKTKDGESSFVIGMLKDITARKSAERELRASEARLNSTLNVLAAEIAILDRDGVIIATNASWQKLADQMEMSPRGAIVGANYLELCASATDENAAATHEVANRIRSLLRGDPPLSPLVQRRECADRRECWHLVTMSRFEENGVPRIVLSYRDVTDLIRTREELARNQESLALALEATHTVTWQWEFDTDRIRWANKQFSFFGKPQRETDYSDFMDMIHPADREAVNEFVNQEIQAGDSRTVEFRVLDQEKGTRWILAKGRLIRDQSGHPVRMLGVNVDVTELKQRDSEIHALAGRLIQAQEEERHRISRELHDDIAQRVSLLTNDMEMLAQQLSATGQHRESSQVRELGKQTDELASEIHRISHDLHSSKLQHLGLRTALRDLCRRFSEMHQIKCELHTESLDRELPSDISLCLFRVTQEGLNNAIKHSHTKEVIVDVIQIREKVLLTIRDLGVGFDTSAPSFGIGLTSMRERLRFAGGTLIVKSTPNEGTEIIAEVSVPPKASSGASAD